MIKRAGYNLLHLLSRLAAVLLFRVRCHGRENLPRSGAVLVCSNHQSHLDPVLIGLALDRRLNFLARESLFRFGPFRWLIEFLDAIPIDRDGMGLAGLRESLRRLRRGEMVLIFPEGTRTPNGEILPLQNGFCTLARRSNVTLLPMAINGAYDAWPRRSLLPKPAKIDICVGEPLTPTAIAACDDDQLVKEVEARIRTCHASACRTDV